MFKKIIKECTNEFIPNLYEIQLPQQQDLFNIGFTTNNSHIKMGLFYEMITSALFGGRLTDSLLRHEGQKREGPIPDVWSKRKGLMGESKALRNGYSLNLLDSQIKLYHKYQIIQPDTRIYYAIWRHQFKNIKKYRGTISNLFIELAQKTIAGIILPFSIIVYLHSIGEAVYEYGTLKRYETDNWDHCTRVSSALLNKFILNTNKTINMIELNSEDYVWGKYMLPNIHINNNQIKPFPFILIADKNHKKWVDAFCDEIPF